MYAITIREPYASLMRNGFKKIETRSWKAPDKYIGKYFLIHAAKKEWKGWRDNENLEICKRMRLFHGRIVALGKLVACVPVDEIIVTDEERKYGFYESGRYAWVFDEIEMTLPVPAKGHLGIWNYHSGGGE